MNDRRSPQLQMAYERFTAQDLQGSSLADVLIAPEADLRVSDGSTVILSEPSFPVVELAWSLHKWMQADEPADFEFNSMSFEEVGTVAIANRENGWRFESLFTPGARSAPLDWHDVASVVAQFVDKIRADLENAGIDSQQVLPRSSRRR